MNKGEGLARWLIQHAARTAPPSLIERLEEEWLADLETRRGRLSRLRLALGCCWATRVIAHEHAVASVQATAAATATGSRNVIAYFQQYDLRFSRRSVAVLGIVALHVVIIGAFMSGLGHGVLITPTPPNIKYVALPDEPHPTPPPPLSPPDLDRHALHIDVRHIIDIEEPPPVLNRDVPPAMEIGSSQPPLIRTPPFDQVRRVLGGPGKGFPSTEDYYPSEALRLNQEGASTVLACVDEKGRLTSAPTITQSSGTPGLDAGALRLAKAGSGHYRPSTENGQPVISCYEYRIAFHTVRR
jgi:TonB family protein